MMNNNIEAIQICMAPHVYMMLPAVSVLIMCWRRCHDIRLYLRVLRQWHHLRKLLNSCWQFISAMVWGLVQLSTAYSTSRTPHDGLQQGCVISIERH